jgi:transcriptional regulator with XRE-family HTH domain
MTDNDIGRKIRDARLNKGYTQQELADRVGVDISSITHFETGFTKPRFKTKLRLNKVLGINLEIGKDAPPLTKIRMSNGYSRAELAQLLGISNTLLRRIEREESLIPNKIIPIMNELLETDFKPTHKLTSDALRKARIAKGRNQTEIAIAMKVSQQDVSYWELGINKIPEKYTEKLIALLSIPIE